jgi:hypothetical protein
MFGSRRGLLGVVVALAACAPTAAIPSASPTDARPSPTPQGSAIPESARPSPSAAAGETEPYVKVLAAQWRPAGATVFVDNRPGVGRGHVVVAVPLTSGSPIELFAVTSDFGDWDVRSDGGAIAVVSSDHCTSGTCVAGPNRIAVVDLMSGKARWITASDPAHIPSSPVWSPDGAFIYYGAIDAAKKDLGIFRVKPDGRERTRVTDPIPPVTVPAAQAASSSRPQRVTTDGTLLWVATQGDKSTLRARDLAQGTDRTFASASICVGALAWRASPPSVLAAEGGCHTAPTRLSLWDLGSGGTSAVVDGSDIVRDSGWDPQGRRIIAALEPLSSGGRAQIAIFDGAARSTLAGGDDAIAVRWLSTGIAFVANTTDAPADCVFGIKELRFMAGGSGPAVSRYRACALERMRAIPGT